MSDCAVDGCERPAARAGYCSGHAKRRQRGQVVNAALAARPSGIERLTEAALRYAEADDDDEFRRAADNLRKAARASLADLAREALAEAKARGVRLGRPPKVEPNVAVEAVKEVGFRAAAARFMVSVRTIRRAVMRMGYPGEWS